MFFVSLTFLLAVASAYELTRIPYQNLADGSIDLKDPLTKVGLVSITDLPSSTSALLDTMFELQHACLVDSPKALKTTFSDGTIRRTLATHSVPGGMQAIGTDCAEFEHAASQVRRAVSVAVTTFAKQLTKAIDAEAPLLKTANEFPFNTLTDVVEYGEALEHFHSYEKPVLDASSSSTSKEMPTIDLHTDQGLFLAFTPGRIGSTRELAKGFFIETDQGKVEEVEFSKDDSLVFLLGDGVNQYVNSKSNVKLRAVPHALQVPGGQGARVWYGRMVLPPSQAIHPMHPGLTFGDLRQGLRRNQNEAVRLACSHDTTTALHRKLEGTSCDNPDEIYCWHRCMSTSDQQISEEICQANSQEIKCINPRGQVWSGESHGDYFPGCVANDTEIETPFPTLPGSPRNEEACTDFAAFVAKECYENSIELPDGDGAVFQWTLKGDVVNARIAYNGLFQYLSVGIANLPDGQKNGMHGANIVMAKAASVYSPSEGLDFTTNPDVQQYVIDPEQSSFRFWNTPVVSTGSLATTKSGNILQLNEDLLASYETTACFTALSFTGNSIGLKSLNLTGTDQMLWAANSVDSFMQYHGANRGVFSVNWLGNGTSDDEKCTTSTSANIRCSWAVAFTTILGALLF